MVFWIRQPQNRGGGGPTCSKSTSRYARASPPPVFAPDSLGAQMTVLDAVFCSLSVFGASIKKGVKRKNWGICWGVRFVSSSPSTPRYLRKPLTPRWGLPMKPGFFYIVNFSLMTVVEFHSNSLADSLANSRISRKFLLPMQ